MTESLSLSALLISSLVLASRLVISLSLLLTQGHPPHTPYSHPFSYTLYLLTPKHIHTHTHVAVSREIGEVGVSGMSTYREHRYIIIVDVSGVPIPLVASLYRECRCLGGFGVSGLPLYRGGG